MATILFTSSADSGTGTLRAAIASAVEGDIIMPDPDIFGTQVTIQLASQLSFSGSKNFTIDGSRTRIILDAQGLGRHATISSTGSHITSRCISFINGSGSSNGVSFNSASTALSFDHCQWHGCDGSGGAYTCLFYVFGSEARDLTFNACLFSGNYCGRGLFFSNLANTAYHFNACTFASNNRDLTLSNAASIMTYTNSVVASYSNPGSSTYIPPLVVLPSNAGYITPGPNSPSAEEIAEWESWNMHLTSSSSLTTGATYAQGEVDLDGVERHQGEGQGSYGCYEYVVQSLLIRIFGSQEWAQQGLYCVDVPLPYSQVVEHFG